MKRTIASLLALALVALIALVASGCASGEHDEHVVDLRAWTLLAPGRAPRSIVLPARVDGDLPHEDSEYVLRTRFEPPSELRGQRLTLAFSFLHAKARLFADGEEMTALDPAMRDGFRGVDQPLWRIPARATAGGAIELELRVEYHHVMNAWLDVAPRVSDTDAGDLRFRTIAWANHAQAVACLVTVSVMALLYAILFLLDRRRAENGWMVIQALCGGTSYALAYTDGLSQKLFGAHENSFVPVLLCLGVVASVQLTSAQFRRSRPHRGWWWALAGCVVLAVAVPSPFVGPRLVPAYSGLMMVAGVAYQLPVAWRLRRRRDASLGATVIFLSWLALAVFGMPDLLAWGGVGEIAWGLRGACLGLGLIGLMQAIVISVAHERALSEADRLNASLSSQLAAVREKNREVELLNEELHRQIAARADALATALARASGAATSSGEPRESDPQVLATGDCVAGRYRVERAIGWGSAGAVYEVTRLSDDERLALKLLKSAADATDMARFAREAQIIAQLDHPNIVRIADVDVSDDGTFFLVTEFVDGLSVRHHQSRYRDVPWALTVLAQVADGLAAIHARGIVHRDLKPANVLLEGSPASPHVRIADFGISSMATPDPSLSAATLPWKRARVAAIESKDDVLRVVPPRRRIGADEPTVDEHRPPLGASSLRHDMPLTRTGEWMGTPRYMAPELADGARNAQPAADVFAFGVMAFELLAGSPPFSESPAWIRARGEPLSPPSFARACPLLDAQLAALLDRCLADAREARPDARALAAALAAEASRFARFAPTRSGISAG